MSKDNGGPASDRELLEMAAKGKTQRKYLKQIALSGYISVSTIDSMLWRKRQILDEMTVNGLIVKYRVSPSYDGYRAAAAIGSAM